MSETKPHDQHICSKIYSDKWEFKPNKILFFMRNIPSEIRKCFKRWSQNHIDPRIAMVSIECPNSWQRKSIYTFDIENYNLQMHDSEIIELLLRSTKEYIRLLVVK